MAMNWVIDKNSLNNGIGDVWYDHNAHEVYMLLPGGWRKIDGMTGMQPPDILIPTARQLEEYPALKDAWEQYLVIRKLIGI